MTNFATKLMVAAATVVVAAGTASAQTLKAEIPFSFRASGKLLNAGTYRVTNRTVPGTFQIANVDDGQAIFVMPAGAADPSKAWVAGGSAVMSFECTETCSLVAIWTGPNTPAYRFPRPKLVKDEPMRTATINLYPTKAD